jgi:hypothetical protein
LAACKKQHLFWQEVVFLRVISSPYSFCLTVFVSCFGGLGSGWASQISRCDVRLAPLFSVSQEQELDAILDDTPDFYRGNFLALLVRIKSHVDRDGYDKWQWKYQNHRESWMENALTGLVFQDDKMWTRLFDRARSHPFSEHGINISETTFGQILLLFHKDFSLSLEKRITAWVLKAGDSLAKPVRDRLQMFFNLSPRLTVARRRLIDESRGGSTEDVIAAYNNYLMKVSFVYGWSVQYRAHEIFAVAAQVWQELIVRHSMVWVGLVGHFPNGSSSAETGLNLGLDGLSQEKYQRLADADRLRNLPVRDLVPQPSFTFSRSDFWSRVVLVSPLGISIHNDEKVYLLILDLDNDGGIHLQGLDVPLIAETFTTGLAKTRRLQ